MRNLHLTALTVLCRFGVLWVRQLVQELRGRTEQETHARCIETPRQNHQEQKVILLARHGRARERMIAGVPLMSQLANGFHAIYQCSRARIL